MGRPSSFTQEIAERICDHLASGKSLRKICEADDMPDTSTVRRWLVQNEAFRLQYARAREEQADFYADEIIGISDDCADPVKARLQVDSRKWYAGKLRPKVYGDKVAVGGDADAPPISMAFRWEQPNGS